MAAIEKLREGTIGERRRHVPNLHQPVEPEVSNAFEVRGFEPRPLNHVREQCKAARGEPFQHAQSEHACVRPDLGVDLAADAAERFVQTERIEIAATLIEQVSRDRRKTGPVRGIGR